MPGRADADDSMRRLQQRGVREAARAQPKSRTRAHSLGSWEWEGPCLTDDALENNNLIVLHKSQRALVTRPKHSDP